MKRRKSHMMSKVEIIFRIWIPKEKSKHPISECNRFLETYINYFSQKGSIKKLWCFFEDLKLLETNHFLKGEKITPDKE